MSTSDAATPRRIALALGSGGARGYAHIGVIEEVQARGWEIIGVAGTSMGAVIGGLFVGGAMESYRDWAVDLVTQREVWFTSGPMIQAMRASIAIPTVFTPVTRNGMVLADGGLLNPVPVAPLANVLADAIIAVNLSAPSLTGTYVREEAFTGIKFPKVKFPNLPHMIEPALRALVPAFGRGNDGVPDNHHVLRMNTLDVVDRSLNLMQEAIRRYRLAGYPPDVLVNVPLDSCGTLDFHRAKDMIEVGRERAARAFDAWEAGEPLVL